MRQEMMGLGDAVASASTAANGRNYLNIVQYTKSE